MAVTTLLDLATQQRAAAAAVRDAAQAAVRQGQTDLSTARDKRDAIAAAYADFSRRVVDIRKQLATVVTAADGDALLDQLEQDSIELRAVQGYLLVAEDTVSLQGTVVEQANTALSQAANRLDQAEAALAEARQRDQKRASFKKKRGESPLATIVADATAALTTPPQNKPLLDAQARVEADIPKALRDRALDRHEQRRLRLDATRAAVTAAEDALFAERNTNGGLAGKAEKLRGALLRAEEVQHRFDTRAKEWFDRALALLAQVADATNEPLTAAQSKRIHDGAALGQPAAAKEKTRDDAVKKVRDAEVVLAQKALAALAKNVKPDDDADVATAKADLKTATDALQPIEADWIDKRNAREAAWDDVRKKQQAVDLALQKAKASKADPNTDPDVVAARAALTAAQAALAAADTAYRTSNKGVLDIWEAAVPDSAWRHLYDLEEAKRLLNLVKNADPAVDNTAVTTAETALATALDKMGASADVLRVLEGERQRRAARLEFEDGAAPRLLFSALRGDL